MATPSARPSLRLSAGTRAILLAAALGLLIRFCFLRSIAW